jgi:hypothetical protein
MKDAETELELFVTDSERAQKWLAAEMHELRRKSIRRGSYTGRLPMSEVISFPKPRAKPKRSKPKKAKPKDDETEEFLKLLLMMESSRSE